MIIIIINICKNNTISFFKPPAHNEPNTAAPNDAVDGEYNEYLSDSACSGMRVADVADAVDVIASLVVIAKPIPAPQVPAGLPPVQSSSCR